MAMRRLPACPLLLDRRRLLTGAAALGATAGLAACGPSEPPVDEEGRIRIRFAIDGLASAEYGGFYQALATGLYEQRGLNVQIFRPGLGQTVTRLLAAGRVELGLGSNSFVPLQLIAEEAPVKAVAAFFQKSPRALIRHVARDSNTPAPTGPVQVDEDDRDTFWPWLRTRYDLAETQRADIDLDAWQADTQASVLGHILRPPALTTDTEAPATVTDLLADNGFASYGAMVLAPTPFARDNEDALRTFITASAEGWKTYIDGDASQADALIRRANRAMTQPLLDQAHEALRAYRIVTGDGETLVPLGTMTAERWGTFYDSAVEAEILPAGLDWQAAFTTDYLAPSKST